MKTITLAALILLATFGNAMAQCRSVPDDAATGYTGNGTALSVCRQNELGDTVRDRQFEQQVAGQLRQLELQMRLNEQLNRAQQNLITTVPTFPAPAFR
jgi:hypothetical protein